MKRMRKRRRKIRILLMRKWRKIEWKIERCIWLRKHNYYRMVKYCYQMGRYWEIEVIEDIINRLISIKSTFRSISTREREWWPLSLDQIRYRFRLKIREWCWWRRRWGWSRYWRSSRIWHNILLERDICYQLVFKATKYCI